MYMPGDRVKYVGNSTFTDDSGHATNLTGKVGEVIAKISGEDFGFVVEFGDDSYVMDGRNLKRHYFAPGAEPVAPKRRRDSDLD